MPDFIIDPEPNPTTVSARLSQEARDAINARVAEWFGHDTELGGYSEDAVKELGRHTL